jgi:hypothetical protein
MRGRRLAPPPRSKTASENREACKAPGAILCLAPCGPTCGPCGATGKHRGIRQIGRKFKNAELESLGWERIFVPAKHKFVWVEGQWTKDSRGRLCGPSDSEKRRLRALFAMSDQDDDDKHVEHVEVARNGRSVEVNVTVGRVKIQVLVTFKQPPGADSTPAKDQS